MFNTMLQVRGFLTKEGVHLCGKGEPERLEEMEPLPKYIHLSFSFKYSKNTCHNSNFQPLCMQVYVCLETVKYGFGINVCVGGKKSNQD